MGAKPDVARILYVIHGLQRDYIPLSPAASEDTLRSCTDCD